MNPAIGLCIANCRMVSSEPVINASIVKTGLRRFGISIVASTAWLPALTERLRTEYKRMLSNTISTSACSDAGQSLWYLSVRLRVVPSTSNLPSSLSNGKLSSGPSRRIVPRSIAPSTIAIWNQLYSLGFIILRGMYRRASPTSLILKLLSRSISGELPSSLIVRCRLIRLSITGLTMRILSERTVVRSLLLRQMIVPSALEMSMESSMNCGKSSNIFEDRISRRPPEPFARRSPLKPRTPGRLSSAAIPAFANFALTSNWGLSLSRSETVAVSSRISPVGESCASCSRCSSGSSGRISELSPRCR